MKQTHRVELYLCLVVLAGLALSFAGHGTFVDENLVIQTVESLLTKGDLSVAPMFQALPGPDGTYYSRYGIAFPLLMLPFYWMGFFLHGWFPQTYAFFGNPHFFMMLWGNILITVITAWLFYRNARLLGGSEKSSAYLALALIFATPFWPYSQTLYRLTAAGAILLAVLYCGLLHLQSPRRSLLAWIVLLTALGLNLREDLVLGFIIIGLYVLLASPPASRWPCTAALIVGAILGTGIWAWHNWVRFGQVYVENYADLSFDYPLIVSLPQLIFGLRRGLVIYAPMSLILLVSFLPARRTRQTGMWLLCAGMMVTYAVLYGKSNMWHGGTCWGPRHLYFLLPFCLLPGVWCLGDSWRYWKGGVFTAAFALGMIMNAPGVYAHQGKYQDFFSSPSIFPLLFKPVVHPEYITFDELDLWWIRMIKMYPHSLFPYFFVVLVTFLMVGGYRLWKELHRYTK